MQLIHQNRPCPCTCEEILVQLTHENQLNHDVRPFRHPALTHWSELDLPPAASLPSTTNLELRSIGSVTPPIVLTKKVHRIQRRASRAEICARDTLSITMKPALNFETSFQFVLLNYIFEEVYVEFHPMKVSSSCVINRTVTLFCAKTN